MLGPLLRSRFRRLRVAATPRSDAVHQRLRTGGSSTCGWSWASCPTNGSAWGMEYFTVFDAHTNASPHEMLSRGLKAQWHKGKAKGRSRQLHALAWPREMGRGSLCTRDLLQPRHACHSAITLHTFALSRQLCNPDGGHALAWVDAACDLKVN